MSRLWDLQAPTDEATKKIKELLQLLYKANTLIASKDEERRGILTLLVYNDDKMTWDRIGAVDTNYDLVYAFGKKYYIRWHEIIIPNEFEPPIKSRMTFKSQSGE
jgi:hypothetical protein